jgi:hypothetical protein
MVEDKDSSTAIRKRIDQLKTFNEIAEELKVYPFVRHIETAGSYGAEVKIDSHGVKTTENYPDSYAIEGFASKIRPFFLKWEGFSFKQNLDEFYRELPISDELKNKYYEWSEALKKFLKDIVIDYTDGTAKTREDVPITFWYGAVPHAHTEERKTLARWKRSEVTNFAVKSKLVDTLWKIFLVIEEVAKINGKAIEELERRLKPK